MSPAEHAGPFATVSSSPCPLCGAGPSDQARACGTCPAVWRCELVCCSRCGYKYPPPSRLVAWVRRLFGPPSPGPAAGTLDEMAVATTCTVESIDGDGPLRLKLAHLGVSEGATLTLEQRRPGIVLRVGQTTLALEPAVARRVVVRATVPPGATPPDASAGVITPAFDAGSATRSTGQA